MRKKGFANRHCVRSLIGKVLLCACGGMPKVLQAETSTHHSPYQTARRGLAICEPLFLLAWPQMRVFFAYGGLQNGQASNLQGNFKQKLNENGLGWAQMAMEKLKPFRSMLENRKKHLKIPENT